MFDIGQTTRLEWSCFIVVNTWLDLEVTATANSALQTVVFVFKDNGAAHEGLFKGCDKRGAAFEINFRGDYMWGYEVEAGAYDTAGNAMKMSTGGGLTYLPDRMVAGLFASSALLTRAP